METVLMVSVVRVEGAGAVASAGASAAVVAVAEMEVIGYETTNFCFPALGPATPTPTSREEASGTLFCRTLEIVLDIFTAAPDFPSGLA